ncbi:aminotransferase class III-fold pyridoxal phosphate-dependent enzyme [Curvivirga aplysinae]|uniref:aminotransferase class III-fold pyridoxal phosphate-dependent enzyme n=1 Tax=Curvivirga aplysinae TaxID=2529852 RepID=UPI0012BD3F23|nr:aminotransferase class III-fold pyridoxal phosphate-dependent enzyme [Curvivirga aplysinae]MTI08871.1 aminotransferase class III-fold pyridoxal phosphate-dependent enzyme [Curvivirga aplysinae]
MNTASAIVERAAEKSETQLGFWQAIVKDHYGVEAELSLLDGEYDLNISMKIGERNWAVLKVMRPGCDAEFVDMQCKAIAHALGNDEKLPLPEILTNKDGAQFFSTNGPNGDQQLVWAITWLDGNLYGNVTPHLLPTLYNVGQKTGALDKALADFSHEYLSRELKWDLQQAGWIKDYYTNFKNKQDQAQILSITTQFEQYLLPRLNKLPKVAIHNDLNDYNLMINHVGQGEYKTSGMIDFGDMVLAPRVCELAIAGAYLVLGQNKPEHALASFVAGYHEAYSLSEDEITLIYPLLLTRLAVSVTNSAIMKQERPDDPYVVISEKPAWDFLRLARQIDPKWIEAHIRVACGYSPLKESQAISEWLVANKDKFHPMMKCDLSKAGVIDLSPNGAGIAVPQNPFDLKEGEIEKAIQQQVGDVEIVMGRYAEPRLIYTEPAFQDTDYSGCDKRTVHMGVDVMVPPGTELFAPCDAVVADVDIRSDHLDYGGVLLLKHTIDTGETFYALYGHLAHNVKELVKVGDKVKPGQKIAEIGDESENGGWAPHLHLQLAVTDFGKGCDIDGVVNADDLEIWKGFFPNPAAMLGLDDEVLAADIIDRDELIAGRKAMYSPNLKLSYKKPIPMIRGWKHFLFDEVGRVYLDAYNNVPHVGHAHPRIQKVAAEQLTKINTNTRYLHPEQVAYAKKLTSWMPEELDCVFFLNSATEANELAMRISQQITGQKDTIVMATGYHGHTNTALALSEYKFNGPGGKGPEDWIHIVPVADVYRGVIREDHPEPGPAYAKYVEEAVQAIEAKGNKTCAYICETFPSVGGQIVLPDGYLDAVYEAVRASGGICIADETQTGLGRIGSHRFGFETQNVVPDMVVLGKPIGNGHPLGALVTKREIVEKFSNGMEFFSTFGGSTLSCVVGHELLKIMEDEKVQENSLETGNYLIEGLKKLGEKYEPIGDVRGSGLFLGVDLVTCRETREPATDMANYVSNRLQQKRILIGTDGPHDNVLKIRPPLTFGKEDADYLLAAMDKIFQETACQL